MNILAIGAHPDDIEIGAGGSIARHVAEGDMVTMLVITKGGKGGATTETREKEAKDAAAKLGVKDCIVLDHKDTEVDFSALLIQEIEEVVHRVKPDRAYVHYYHEIHQDHRTVFSASISALRNTPQILMFEGPSTFPDFVVDYWMDVSKYMEQKKSAILAHSSQGNKEILKLDAIVGMNTYRGFQCRKQYAEGFKIFRMFE